MGRRSQHTPDQLRGLILDAARRIVETKGFHEASAREIAREIGYAPGTLYNMFKNLDDIMLHVECGVLEALDGQLANATAGRKGLDAVRRFASCYVEFAYANPLLWQLVRERHPVSRDASPDWYLDRLYAPKSRLEGLIARASTPLDAEEISRAAHLVWATVHGLLSVVMTPKLGTMSLAKAQAMAEAIASQQATFAFDHRPGSGRLADGQLKSVGTHN